MIDFIVECRSLHSKKKGVTLAKAKLEDSLNNWHHWVRSRVHPSSTFIFYVPFSVQITLQYSDLIDMRRWNNLVFFVVAFVCLCVCHLNTAVPRYHALFFFFCSFFVWEDWLFGGPFEWKWCKEGGTFFTFILKLQKKKKKTWYRRSSHDCLESGAISTMTSHVYGGQSLGTCHMRAYRNHWKLTFCELLVLVIYTHQTKCVFLMMYF